MANELSLLKPIVESERADSHESRREMQRLEDEIRSLRRDLEDVTAEKDRLARTVKNLQTTLNPMYRAFRALFGELELAVGVAPNEVNAHAAASSSADPRWESFKTQLGPLAAEIIDALLIHNEMTILQLAHLLKHNYKTIAAAALKLRTAGAVTYSPRTPVSLKR